ncbi:Uu.00g088750.m01.CDS01 [Anthostomella pinea]|uniref:Uu.00g088750.m01.CDS01 n=1 Tax=Anthostomella pinea TaxID=933095 RepID=A0AAI8VMJ9_9PEZI|nr:Uu.00g088750.m01.CDS01 [Anthostomella pinea]
MHYLRIKNRSNHAQTFQCHGAYNGGKDLTIMANGEANIEAPDGTSGAIIAVHDGVIGEQCEITKSGWMGNDTIDISNIVGAGGNMTCQQVGDPAGKYKGHETFMQACNTAYHKLPQAKKDQLKGHVFLDGSGNVKRIGPPKDSQPLEQFVRTFANGRTYIGVGAWGGNAGNPEDNKQSSAGKGSKDILIVYSNGNAAPDPSKPFTGQSIQGFAMVATANTQPDQPQQVALAAKNDVNAISVNKVENASQPAGAAIKTLAAAATTSAPGPGIQLTNHSAKKNTYYFYDNYWNGNGTAGANFDHPLKHVELAPNQTVHVPLSVSFKGRVQRGRALPATWGEFQVKASNDGKAHGDISLQQGCDGAATVASTDGTGVSNGFTKNIVRGAPAAALGKKPDGEVVLASTEGNWNGPGNQAAVDWENKQLGQGKAYIKGGTGVPDIASKNNCLHFTFYVV